MIKSLPCCLILLLAGWGVPLGASAADVSDYTIIKSQNYAQATNGLPTLLATNGYAFACVVLGASNTWVLGATVKPPGATPLRTLLGDTNGTLWEYTDATNTSAALDALYPASFGQNYTVTMQTVHDGTRSGTLSFAFISAPPTPQINNLAAAQNLASSADFTLQFNALGGGTVIGQLTILDAVSNVVFSTPAPLQSGALSGSTTSVVIPAHTLPPGSALTGLLTAAQPGLPTTTYATGIPALARVTQFPLSTRPLAPPQLTVLAHSSVPFEFRLTGETNVNYQILTSTNLTDWVLQFTTNSPVGVIDFTASPLPGADREFFRSRAVQ